MNRFILRHAESGIQFTLYSPSGRALAVSKPYATLDACKKAIRALMLHAPTAPAVTADKPHSNPKFELLTVDGGVCYALKAPNGKTVLTSAPFATQKACLRALSMLRTGVRDATVWLEQYRTLLPLKI